VRYIENIVWWSVLFGLIVLLGVIGPKDIHPQVDDYSNLASAHGEPDEQFEATPMIIVEQMLDEIHVGPGDVLMDMGSGDGRIPIAATQRGARAIGVDIDPRLIQISRENAAKAGVTVEWRAENFFTTDLSGVTIVTFFMSPRIIARLWPRLQCDLPHARIVSYAYEGPIPPTRMVPAIFRDSAMWEPNGLDLVNLAQRAVIRVWDHP